MKNILLLIFMFLSTNLLADNYCNPEKARFKNLPVGTICPYFKPEHKNFVKLVDSNPKWVRTDGRELSKSEYPELFEVVSVIFKIDDDNFTIPDTRGRMVNFKDGESKLTNYKNNFFIKVKK